MRRSASLGLDEWLPEVGSTGLPEAGVKVTSEMIAVGDYPALRHQDGVITPLLSEENDDWVSDRHNKGANVVFCDSHVEYAKQKKWMEATDLARRRWNRDNEPHRETWH